MARIRRKIVLLAETGGFLSEKLLPRGKLAIATLTSDKGFAAKNSLFMTGELFCEES